MFRRILAPIDGSPYAERALREAIDLANATNAELTVMTVVPELPAMTLSGAGITGFDVEPLMEANERQYSSVLDVAVDAVPDGIQVARVLAHGPPAPRIVEQTQAGEHDLVVMGSRGRGEVKSLLLGSVSHAVLNTSRVAVLMVHAPGDGA